ncbi:Laccase-6, partial [Ananas comosus]
VQTLKVTKLCKTRDIVTINGMYPGPVVYAQEDDRVIVKVTNETPYNATIHWHGVRQRLSCWSDGPSYITQCPIQSGQTFTYEFTLFQQKGTLLWHAHVSWLRGTVYGAIVVYPKTGVPYPFPTPYEEHILILGEYWNKDVVQLEKQVLASGGAAPPADAFLINGHPGPRYNCSAHDYYKIDVVPGKTYLLRLINAALNTEHFFSIAEHKMTVVEADGEYTKPFATDHLMLGPGQTTNVLVTADRPIAKYEMAMGPYMSAQNVTFQNISAVAYFQYTGAGVDSLGLPAQLPAFNNNLVVKTNMDGLRSLNAPASLPLEIDANLLFTVGLNVDKCDRAKPNKTCQGPNGGIFAASMNNVSFVRPTISLLQAYYSSINGHYTEDFPGVPLRAYDFVHGAPNNIPNDTQSRNGTKVYVLDYGSRVQLVFQDTGTVTTENHPIHLHGYSFYVVGYGTGNYNPSTAKLNLVDPPYMNTIGVPVGGWAAVRFIADNPGVWFVHCHLEVHMSWGLSMAFIVKNGQGPLETLPHPPSDLPRC